MACQGTGESLENGAHKTGDLPEKSVLRFQTLKLYED